MSKQYEMYLTLEKNKIAQAKQVILANLEYVGIEELLEDLGIDYSAYQLCALSEEENAALEQKLAGYLENVFFEEKGSSLKAAMNPGLYDPDSYDYAGSQICQELFRLWPDSHFEFSGTADLFSIHWFGQCAAKNGLLSYHGEQTNDEDDCEVDEDGYPITPRHIFTGKYENGEVVFTTERDEI